MKITRIEATRPGMSSKKKVAAYARVSRDSERLLHSLGAQVSHYEKLIKSNPEWEYVGIYADEAITGTLISKRKEFQRLLEDCEAGKVDIILTKSIQRFARNTVDLLETVRHLKAIGVEVRFEKERINTLAEDGELMITILASFAQEEMRSMSENIKWAFKKKMEAGKVAVPVRTTGYMWEDRKLVVIPEEAEIVRRIYREFLDGKSSGKIAKDLDADGIKSIHGKSFNGYMVLYILRNVIYKGDLLLQKYFSADPITKVQKKNRGEKDKYLVENDHEAIIDDATFEAVQIELSRRSSLLCTKQSENFKRLTFSRKVRCPVATMFFRHDDDGTWGNNGAWRCWEKTCKHRDHCDCMGAPQLAIEQACTRALGLTKYDDDAVNQNVKEVRVLSYGRIEVELHDGSIYEDYYRDRNNLANLTRNENTFRGMLLCGNCKGAYIGKWVKYRGGHMMIWTCPHHDNSVIHENIIRHRIAEVSGWDEFSKDKLQSEVDYIEMDRPLHFTIHYKDGTTKTVEYYAVDIRRKIWKEQSLKSQQS